MFNQDLKKKIQTVRTLQGIGSPRPEWMQINREILLMQVKNTLGQRVEEKKIFNFGQVWQFMDVFLPSQTVYYVVRPIVVVLLIAGIMMGSWVTTVSASYNSLPGDILYSVKLATESVQTTLAPKPQETKLRMEFASRRADEVKKIVKSNVSKKETKVAEAVKHLKSDLEQVKGNLDEMKKSAPVATSLATPQVVEVAKAVDQKVTEIQKSLEQTTTQLVNEASTGPVVAAASATGQTVQEQVKQAAAVAVETGVKAVEVMVEKHQEDKTAVSSDEVKSSVDSKLKTLEEKVTKVEEQISTIVATSTPSATLKEQKQNTATLVAPAKETVAVAKEAINQAKNDLSKENFDAALDKLKQSSVLTQAAEVKTEATKILVAPASTQGGPPAVIATSTVGSTASSTPQIMPSSKAQNTTSTSALINVPAVIPMVTSTLPSKEEIRKLGN